MELDAHCRRSGRGRLISRGTNRVVTANGGFYHFRAVSGDALSAQVKGNSTYIYDESGNASRITIADVDQSNGVIHVIENVLLPR